MIYAVENGDYAVTDHVPRRLDAPENLVQSLRLLLTPPRQGYYPRPVGGVGGAGQICCRTNCWRWVAGLSVMCPACWCWGCAPQTAARSFVCGCVRKNGR